MVMVVFVHFVHYVCSLCIQKLFIVKCVKCLLVSDGHIFYVVCVLVLYFKCSFLCCLYILG